MPDIMSSKPKIIDRLFDEAKQINFSMSCDDDTGSLLKTLCASKTEGVFLEIGTGVGVSTSWMLAGMDAKSTLDTIELDAEVQSIARKHMGFDQRATFHCIDGDDYIRNHSEKKYDLIFADSWPGKFRLVEETLNMLYSGGIYVIDDLIPNDSWQTGHHEKVMNLIALLNGRNDLNITQLDWSTGIIIAVKSETILISNHK